MSPRFAQAVDPIFLYALALLDRIGKGKNPDPAEEKLRLRTMIDKAEATLGTGGEWELAKYAIVSWIDEMLVESLWEGRDWWNNNVLEVELFNTRQCHEQFFVRAQEASGKSSGSSRDALEVFYVCVILGFRGLYHDPETGGEIAKALSLPVNLKQWTRQTAMSIRLGQGLPQLADPGRQAEGAPPLRPRSVVVWPWLMTLLMIGVVVVVAFYKSAPSP